MTGWRHQSPGPLPRLPTFVPTACTCNQHSSCSDMGRSWWQDGIISWPCCTGRYAAGAGIWLTTRGVGDGGRILSCELRWHAGFRTTPSPSSRYTRMHLRARTSLRLATPLLAYLSLPVEKTGAPLRNWASTALYTLQ